MDAAGLRPAFLGRMYEKRNNFQGITVNSVRQEFKNWIIIFLYTNLFKLSLFLKRVRREIPKSLYEEMHGVFLVFRNILSGWTRCGGVCDLDSVHSTMVPDPAYADPAGALSGKGGANICFSNQGI